VRFHVGADGVGWGRVLQERQVGVMILASSRMLDMRQHVRRHGRCIHVYCGYNIFPGTLYSTLMFVLMDALFREGEAVHKLRTVCVIRCGFITTIVSDTYIDWYTNTALPAQ
jgi:hypothetical protein